MKAQIYKEDTNKPYYQGELLAELTVNRVKGQSPIVTVNNNIWALKDYLQLVHKCTLIVKISENQWS